MRQEKFISRGNAINTCASIKPSQFRHISQLLKSGDPLTLHLVISLQKAWCGPELYGSNDNMHAWYLGTGRCRLSLVDLRGKAWKLAFQADPHVTLI